MVIIGSSLGDGDVYTSKGVNENKNIYTICLAFNGSNLKQDADYRAHPSYNRFCKRVRCFFLKKAHILFLMPMAFPAPNHARH